MRNVLGCWRTEKARSIAGEWHSQIDKGIDPAWADGPISKIFTPDVLASINAKKRVAPHRAAALLAPLWRQALHSRPPWQATKPEGSR